MSVKPILFNTEMVKAILDGRKTVTRRLGSWKIESYSEETGDIRTKIVQQTKRSKTTCNYYGCKEDLLEEHAPYQPGDLTYVRETWQLVDFTGENDGFVYKASENGKDWEENTDDWKWRPSIHMPKQAARIWLKVTNVRVERLQDITHTQAEREGVGSLFFEDIAFGKECYKIPYIQEEGLSRHQFAYLWDSTIKKPDIDKYGWEANPFVWVIEFERCEKPQEGSH